MSVSLTILGILLATFSSLVFSALTYSLRDFSRTRLTDVLTRRGKLHYVGPTLSQANDLIFVTAVFRLFSNILVLIGVLRLFQERAYYGVGWQYFLSIVVTGSITLVCSVIIPHAISRHAAEHFIATFVQMLHGLRAVLMPVTKLMHLTDALVERAASRGGSDEPEKLEQEVEQEIIAAVEEGAKEGFVDEDERAMIESVIAFHNTQVGQIMTARPEIYSLDVNSTLEGVKSKIAESGHSRIPVFEGSLDHIVGVLYARDLIRHLGQPPDGFDLRAMMRPAYYVPETKPLRDLLKDFRRNKVHIAIVSDEYGGTAGLVTIEDIFEELVGDISDEHEPVEPEMLVRLDDLTAEADARIYIDALNDQLDLSLPTDAGYDTLGGFVSNTLGRIPEAGTTFEHEGVKFTILDAEPQKVNRVKLELALQAVPENDIAAGSD
ncbi:MAG TPA: hemolysin family protein [Tepidisphaeraceae bacterium]|nr:hemolysin family protein [Tepidisphaeraceae bacterium]